MTCLCVHWTTECWLACLNPTHRKTVCWSVWMCQIHACGDGACLMCAGLQHTHLWLAFVHLNCWLTVWVPSERGISLIGVVCWKRWVAHICVVVLGDDLRCDHPCLCVLVPTRVSTFFLLRSRAPKKISCSLILIAFAWPFCGWCCGQWCFLQSILLVVAGGLFHSGQCRLSMLLLCWWTMPQVWPLLLRLSCHIGQPLGCPPRLVASGLPVVMRTFGMHVCTGDSTAECKYVMSLARIWTCGIATPHQHHCV